MDKRIRYNTKSTDRMTSIIPFMGVFVQERVEGHDREFRVLTWPPNSSDLSPM